MRTSRIDAANLWTLEDQDCNFQEADSGENCLLDMVTVPAKKMSE